MAREAEVRAILTDIFRSVFMRSDLELTSGLSAKDVPGWDSFKQIEIIMAIEERLAIRMSTRELDSLQNVGDLMRVVLVRTAQPKS
jgi:acyl carrier protein